ncbi:hypothetical protein [Paraburkholderia phenoliruptrix]|uniref:hypothetical protein n=1 Tax=Paraburkholderia phenoliruptrix TaxID=252970 RepID=UPI001C500029|nr:hypothetical protein [Paraburkholderia phenoliruptrix]MBW0450885.1 hypothetical protein [Paraburkholderia phenoliruptrix]MBW9100978.1 hypothetical protein [Paraburkholderia phenoliruptrix]
MIRFILKTKFRDGHNGQEGEYFKTLDLDVPELQEVLSAGGLSESSYDATQLVGVEIICALSKDQTK